MTETHSSPSTRHWADVLAILVGVSLLALATWPGEQNAAPDASRDLGRPQLAQMMHVLAGGMTILALFVAQRAERRGIARLMMLAGVVGLLVAFAAALTTGTAGPRTWLTLLLPAALLGLAALRVGPMPRSPHADAPTR